MKKIFFLTLGLVLPMAALAQGTLKVGTVDMNRAFKEYSKTKDAEAKINDAKNQAKKEYDERGRQSKNGEGPRRQDHKHQEHGAGNQRVPSDPRTSTSRASTAYASVNRQRD